MEKYSLFPGRTREGAPLIHLVEPGSTYGLNKTAGLGVGEHLPQVIELVESIQPQPDRLYLVNSALGAGEFVGVNLRGDWFDEAGLTHAPPGWDKIPVWDIEARRQAANHAEEVGKHGPLAWGYPTFYNAHRFRHHQNKDPNRAYGFILGAFYDYRMHRVVLVSELIRDLCVELGALDIYSRIECGDFVDTSMGCKVPSDICLICGHEAKTPAAYCEHVRVGASAPYGMKSILPDGRVCGVRNLYPRFFDDSFVFIGAERSAKVMLNLTDRVVGNRPYSQRIFSFAPPTKMAEAPRTEVEEQDAKIQQGIKALKKEAPETTFEEKLSKIMAGLDLKNEPERDAARHFSDEKRLAARLASGEVTENQAAILSKVSRNTFERKHKRGLGDFSDLQKSIDAALAFTESVKAADVGSSKFAEILKRIPSPTPSQMATIKGHADKLPPLTDPVLEELSRDPFHNVRAAARLGVVLRPEEFQDVLLRGRFPEEAREYRDAGEVFCPAPLTNCMNRDSEFHTEYDFPKEVIRRITAALGPLLAQRSFAPMAVRIQIASAPRSSMATSKLVPKSDPLLDKVAELYNDYRAGLLAFPPDWRYVEPRAEMPPMSTLEEEVKLADDAQELSNWLLRLAFWPSLFVG